MLEREDGISIGRKEKYNNDLIDLYQLLKIRNIQGRSIWFSFGRMEKCNNDLINMNKLWKKGKLQKWLDQYKSAMEETKNSKMTWSIWTSFGIKKKYNNDLIDLNKPWKKGKIQQWLVRSVSAFEHRKNTRTRSIWFSFGRMIKCINDLIDLNQLWKKKINTRIFWFESAMEKKHQWLDLNQLLKKIQKWLDRYKSAMEETKNSKMTWSIWTSFGIKK